MIYLDHAATSHRKPKAVIQAVVSELKSSANPGRSSHHAGLAALNRIWEAREQLARLFHVKTPERFILTPNATYGLNFAIKGYLSEGQHVVTTSMEHNSVYRPLQALSGIEVTRVKGDSFGFISSQDIKKAIRPDTALIIVNHSSNVNGVIQDIQSIRAIAKNHNLPVLLDLSQTAGVLDVDLNDFEMAALPGHKSLYGPQGTGALYLAPGIQLKTIIEGGTGTNSKELYNPEDFPERLESGTLNTPGFFGLAKGIEFVLKEGISSILAHKHHLLSFFLEEAYNMNTLKIYSPKDANFLSNSVAFQMKEKESTRVADLLSEQFDIAVRPGFHCAYPAHETLGTLPTGAVRISVSYFNKLREIKKLIDALHKISKEP